MPEFDLIRRLQEIIAGSAEKNAGRCVVGIGDDGAVLDVADLNELVVCTDTLVEGVHFLPETCPSAIGHKALAVNLSDLAAMGADPGWFFMALTLPSEDRAWLDDFADGMARLATRAGVTLAGGDICQGPLSITITALGWVGSGKVLVRSGAGSGDFIVVSGTPGAAAHALKMLCKGEIPPPRDRAALDTPEPRLELGQALRGIATACIDVSDGLLADLGHILEQSGVGAVVELDSLPCPPSIKDLADEERWSLQLAGGDDYELCFTIPPGSVEILPELARSCGVGLTVIGVINDRGGLELMAANAERYQPEFTAYRHFDDSGAGGR